MSQKMQEAYAEYLRIAELFRNGDPSADDEWRNFVTKDNGWTLAAEIVCHH